MAKAGVAKTRLVNGVRTNIATGQAMSSGVSSNSSGGSPAAPATTTGADPRLEQMKQQLTGAQDSLNKLSGNTNIPQAGQSGAQAGQTSANQAQTGQLTQSFNGSVVDLLNGMGAPSSFNDRTALAQQFGIQNYTGTAQQNTDLAKKYQEFHKGKQGTEAPGANPRQEMSSLGQDPEEPVDAEQDFLKGYFGMNPMLKSFYDSINTVTSTSSNRNSLVEEYQKIRESEGIDDLQMELVDINTIIDGTEDDIRAEVTATGGLATDSQVMALAGARNKVLLKQASALQATLDQKTDYIDQIMRLTQADRETVENDIDRKIGLTEKMFSLVESMDRNASENYRAIVNDIGYAGLAKGLQNNPLMRSNVERSLGLPVGALSDPDWLSYATKATAKAGDKPQIIGSADAGYYTVSYDENGNPIVKSLIRGTGGGNDTGSSGYKFSANDYQQGSANAGMDLSQFKSLPADVQNLYISNKDEAQYLVDILGEVSDGSLNYSDGLAEIQAENVPAGVKNYFTTLLPQNASNTTPEGGGAWSWLKGLFTPF